MASHPKSPKGDSDAATFNFVNLTRVLGLLGPSESQTSKKQHGNNSSNVKESSKPERNENTRFLQERVVQNPAQKKNIQITPNLQFSKPEGDKLRKTASQAASIKNFANAKGKDHQKIPAFDDCFPKLESKSLLYTSRKDKFVFPYSTRSNNTIAQDTSGFKGPLGSARNQFVRKSSLKPPDQFRKTFSSRMNQYGTALRESSQSEDEQQQSPERKLLRSRSHAKISKFNVETNVQEMHRSESTVIHPTAQQQQFQLQPQSHHNQQQRSSSPKIVSNETETFESPFVWKEKAKLRKIVDLQNPKQNPNSSLAGQNQLVIIKAPKPRSLSINELSKEIEISANKIIKRLGKVVVETSQTQDSKQNPTAAAQEGEREDNQVVAKIPYYIRDRNYYFALRLDNYIEFLTRANFSNMLFVIPLQRIKLQCIYKYHVMRGNNHVLIKNAFKHRWWWQPVELNEGKTYDNINFLWSPWRINDFVNTLKKHDFEALVAAKEDSQLETSASPHNESSEKDKLEDYWAKASKAKTLEEKQGRDFSTATVDPKLHPNLKKIYSPVDFKHNLHYDQLLGSVTDRVDRRNQLFMDEWKKSSSAHSKYQFGRLGGTLSSKMYNHLENNFLLSNKKALFLNLRHYYIAQKLDPFDHIPLTFHIRKGVTDPEFARFKDCYEKKAQEAQEMNIWIVKPGENTNRGFGITICQKVEEIEEILNTDTVQENGHPKTFIVQKYIEKPLLYQRRKFDIRCYILITSINGIQKGYWYQDGYIRTSSSEFSLENLGNVQVHLTNDAVQKKCEDYGKRESGNKVSYSELQKYFDTSMPEKKINFMGAIYPQMKKLALDAIISVFGRIDPQRRDFSFELFGLDFMIDESSKPYLIEINTNPCLELSAPLLAKIIPTMIENLFRLVIDPIFPPPLEWPISRRGLIPENCLDNNKFELIFDERDADIPKFGINTANQHLGQIIDECEEDYETELME